MTLSNRRRKAQRKVTAKPARKAKPALVVVGATLGGVAARESVRDQLRAQAVLQNPPLALHLAVAVAVGNMKPSEVSAALGIESVSGKDYERVEELWTGQHVVASQRALRLKGRDGLVALFASGALTALQVKAGLAFRYCYEAAAQGLGSGLGNAGEGRVARDWSRLEVGKDAETGALVLARSALSLHRAYILVRLNQAERAVGDILEDGRELHALRQIAGEGHTVRQVAGASGHARDATVKALARALDAIAKVLRITGQ